MKVNTLKLNSPLLPEDFRHIPDPPKQLFYKGNLQDFASRPRLAVVGSRKVTPYGRAVTQKIVGELAKRGVVIVSGLALGIDSVAHQAALGVGGTTVAVLACGLDKVYPVSHNHLAQQIIGSGGALVSEYPEGTPILPHQFIARNRLISGLADGLLITEAAQKSGSLHTANFALDQGKTVMAVPGNITSTTSIGTNNLIKSGAVPITSVSDVLIALGLDDQMPVEIVADNPEQAIILKLIQAGVSASDEILVKSELKPEIFNQTLTMLEITGKVRSLGAGHWGLA